MFPELKMPITKNCFAAVAPLWTTVGACCALQTAGLDLGEKIGTKSGRKAKDWKGKEIRERGGKEQKGKGERK